MREQEREKIEVNDFLKLFPEASRLFEMFLGKVLIEKEPIPKGTEVEVICYWFNFYGVYFMVEHNNRYYDIDTKDIKLVKKEQ